MHAFRPSIFACSLQPRPTNPIVLERYSRVSWPSFSSYLERRSERVDGNPVRTALGERTPTRGGTSRGGGSSGPRHPYVPQYPTLPATFHLTNVLRIFEGACAWPDCCRLGEFSCGISAHEQVRGAISILQDEGSAISVRWRTLTGWIWKKIICIAAGRHVLILYCSRTDSALRCFISRTYERREQL
ncbi:hypothetical protein PENSPDRAFT_215350 [Peniophora sp. CONT]|nr:hypothetical protein PENSPDRAFT_215350 [Peniophora sp. CONT]